MEPSKIGDFAAAMLRWGGVLGTSLGVLALGSEQALLASLEAQQPHW